VRWIAPEDDRAYLMQGRWKDNIKLQPHVMFRVADVMLAFGQVQPACDGQFVIEVTGDNMRPETMASIVSRPTRKNQTEKANIKPQFSCGVGTLARILTGYMDAQERWTRAGVRGKDNLDLLMEMYPKQRDFLFELY